jgi:hypothetical protein
MSEQNEPREMHKALFVSLVMMLGTSAMQHMGKLVDPQTGKAEAHLEGAQQTIDLLVMLAEKTKGNLDKDEERLLKDTLSSLQLTFVQSSPQQAESEAKAAPPAAESSPTEKQEPAAKLKPENEAKYHKSYG